MVKSKAEILLEKYNNSECTPEEKAIVETWFLETTINVEDHLPEPDYDTLKDQLWDNILIKNKKPSVKLLWPRIAAAAAILILISVSGYFFLHKPSGQQIAQNQPNDVAPGSSQATLTLANGKKIILKKGLNGKLAQQGNTLIQVNSGNAIAYTTDNVNADNTEVMYNTLSTKNGEQSPYPLILADGTKVWLNAASSITFPTAFSGKDRKVTITGEAYLEVMHNADKPFNVEVKNQTIEDIGTHFNINAYDDEPSMKTTLLEGSIRVSNGIDKAILKPGQQSIIKNESDYIKIENADTEEVLAWKNGVFIFNDEPLESIMRKVSRWYDVDVIYQGIDRHKSFWGGVSRYDNVSKVLQKLELTGGVHFTVEGRRIIAKK